MENYENKWMIDICTEINNKDSESPGKSEIKWDPNKFINSIDLFDKLIEEKQFDFLNNKNLINRGFCPVTGEQISTEYFYLHWGKNLFLSKKGDKIAQEYQNQKMIKLHGKEKAKEMEDFMKKRQNSFNKNENSDWLNNILFLGLIILILFLIKGCLN
jgi:ABC-type multidrug transport system fused ATPase/permease subunit